MRIGVLYESDEWSDHKLAAELARAFGAAAPNAASAEPAAASSAPNRAAEDADAQSQVPEPARPTCAVELIDMRSAECVQQALGCDVLVSRVFASAAFRGHEAALAHMAALIPAAADAGIPLVNDGRAHAFEVSKRAASAALAAAGLAVPATFACGLPDELDPAELPYPCIIKPDCGGRTTLTTIARSTAEAAAFLRAAPPVRFLAQEYIAPERGFITRAEIVGGEPTLVVKRSIAANGLSAYRFGSTYELYPDCPATVQADLRQAARELGFTLGSFDVIETARGAFFIDANSVSNVSEDCTALFGMDLMRAHAEAIARLAPTLARPRDGTSASNVKQER